MKLAGGGKRSTTLGLFTDSEFAKVWLIGLFSGVVRWLELLAFGIYAYEITGSPVLVALLAVLRLAPLALFGVLIGALADIFRPRFLMMLGLVVATATSFIMFLIFTYGAPAYWHVALAAFISGSVWAGDFPVRRRMMADRAPPEKLASAMAIDNATSNGTRGLGPLMGGALYEALGLDGVFLLGAVLYGGSFLIGLAVRPSGEPRPADTPRNLLTPFRDALAAMGAARRDRDAAAIILVTVIFNIWGFPYMAMIPVIGADELGLSPSLVGALTGLEGLFALVGAILVARYCPQHLFRAIYAGAVLSGVVALAVLGAFPGLYMFAIALCLMGLFTSAFAVMQATLIYQVAPPGMQGRFMGLITIAIGTGVIGFANVGLTAELVGASNALIVIGLQGLGPILWLIWWWRRA